MMPSFMEPEFSPWFGTDWPTTTETLENVQEVSLLYLALSSPGFRRGSYSWFPKQPRVLSRTG